MWIFFFLVVLLLVLFCFFDLVSALFLNYNNRSFREDEKRWFGSILGFSFFFWERYRHWIAHVSFVFAVYNNTIKCHKWKLKTSFLFVKWLIIYWSSFQKHRHLTILFSAFLRCHDIPTLLHNGRRRSIDDGNNNKNDNIDDNIYSARSRRANWEKKVFFS